MAGEPGTVRWARWWLWLWGAVAVGLIVLALTPVLSFKWWAVAALIGFGSMEGYGLYRPNDPYPPLTQVIRRYVPRWAAFPAIYGITAAAGAVWLEFPQPARLGLLFALVGWLTTHFETTFDEKAVEEERDKLERLPVLRALSPRRRAAGSSPDGSSVEARSAVAPGA